MRVENLYKLVIIVLTIFVIITVYYLSCRNTSNIVPSAKDSSASVKDTNDKTDK